MLKQVEEFTSWATFSFNIRKCGTLHCNRSGRRNFVVEDALCLGEQVLPILRYKDHYRYLGCDLGADPKAHLNKLEKDHIKKVSNIIESIKKVSNIIESKLAEWQKLEAIRRFIHPTLDYVIYAPQQDVGKKH